MKKTFYVVVFSTLLLSGCLTTAPKGGFSQDTRQTITNSEALIGVCRSLQFTLGNGRILTASVNDDQAASLIGGAGVEIIVPSGKQKIKVTISGLVVDVGVLETTLNAPPSSSSYLVVDANNSSLISDRKVGTTESFTWGLKQVNADEFLKACPQKAIRVRKPT
jgi:PBP1b-binding outer membrane lipoprotein LpoB